MRKGILTQAAYQRSVYRKLKDDHPALSPYSWKRCTKIPLGAKELVVSEILMTGREKDLPESLTDEEKKRLSEERAEARKRALESPRYREVKDAFLQDPVRRQKTCGELLKKWKKEYRRMS